MHPSTPRLLRDPLFPALLFLLIALLFYALFLISYRYAVYTMLTLFSLVAVAGAFTLFNGDATKFFSAFVIYVLLAVPFFLAYSRSASRVEVTSAAAFAMASIVMVLTAAFLLGDVLLGSHFFKLFQLAKRFIESRRWRYSLSLFSIIVFAAGVTSLSFILPLYALIVFFLIVICEVAINMIDNIYERRKEIFSLATVGLNPDHLTGLFLAQAFVIGFLGGGVGYAVGLYVLLLTSLRITTFEISTGWMVGIILFSIVTAIVSAILPALKASMLATPSLLKRWWREAPPFLGWPPTWTFKIPVRVTKDNAERFINFFLGYARMLEGFSHGSIERAEEIEVVTPEALSENAIWALKFKYIYNELSSPMIISENQLRIHRDSSSGELTAEFTIKVTKFQNVPNIYECLERIASTYRKLALEWTVKNLKAYVPSSGNYSMPV